MTDVQRPTEYAPRGISVNAKLFEELRAEIKRRKKLQGLSTTKGVTEPEDNQGQGDTFQEGETQERESLAKSVSSVKNPEVEAKKTEPAASLPKKENDSDGIEQVEAKLPEERNASVPARSKPRRIIQADESSDNIVAPLEKKTSSPVVNGNLPKKVLFQNHQPTQNGTIRSRYNSRAPRMPGTKATRNRRRGASKKVTTEEVIRVVEESDSEREELSTDSEEVEMENDAKEIRQKLRTVLSRLISKATEKRDAYDQGYENDDEDLYDHYEDEYDWEDYEPEEVPKWKSVSTWALGAAIGGVLLTAILNKRRNAKLDDTESLDDETDEPQWHPRSKKAGRRHSTSKVRMDWRDKTKLRARELVKNQVENYAAIAFVPTPFVPAIKSFLKSRRARRVRDMSAGLEPVFLTKKEILSAVTLAIPIVKYIVQDTLKERSTHKDKSNVNKSDPDRLIQKIRRSSFGLTGSPAALAKKRSFYQSSTQDKPRSFKVGEHREAQRALQAGNVTKDPPAKPAEDTSARTQIEPQIEPVVEALKNNTTIADQPSSTTFQPKKKINFITKLKTKLKTKPKAPTDKPRPSS